MDDTAKRIADLEKILSLRPPEKTFTGPVSFLDETFADWLKRTGELPPDFDRMPSLPFLPDPLIIDEGRTDTPVRTINQWNEKREWMRNQLMHYITGTVPPAPDNLRAQISADRLDGRVRLQMIHLSFGPDHQARLTLELMIPPGQGPFPVFLTQWSHREWALQAVRRGYIGCVYAGADSKDDTEQYAEVWAGKFDFTRLMRRAFGASRAVDYLLTLPIVEKDKIAITGHSRNGKTSLMAAAFDERIAACIPSSGGIGGEVPWRYSSPNFGIETDIATITAIFPSWFHPRLNFFIGREHKLPIDQNSFMALIAPRALMLSTALSESISNPWAIELAYQDTKKVYEFLGAPHNLAIRSRYGLHSVSAHDIDDYIDFFDYVFKRGNYTKPDNRLLCSFSFEKWLDLSGEKINPSDFPVKDLKKGLILNGNGSNIRSLSDWEDQKWGIHSQIRWLLGDEPAGVTNSGPRLLKNSGCGEACVGSFLFRPRATSRMGVMNISPYKGFGDNLFGYLYYPKGADGKPINDHLPVVIYLHNYNYAEGFSPGYPAYREELETFFQSVVDAGVAVFAFDLFGFGNRLEDASRFYERYPHWSKLGRMVVDVEAAVTAMLNLEFVDPKRVFVIGYSLGGTVGLFSAALDERITGVVSVAGFTPMRSNTLDRGTEGVKTLSHLHGLLPRLGFFVGNEARIPCDFSEILSCIAPRPLLVIAPRLDKDAHYSDVVNCMNEVRTVYGLYKSENQIRLVSPCDFNRFSPETKREVLEWLRDMALRAGQGIR